jgi:hypothetical protein
MTWWLSFASKAGHLGIVLVDADDVQTALLRAKHAGVNPGGEVAAYVLPPREHVPPELRADADKTYNLPRLTLLSRADLETRVGKMISSREAEAAGYEPFEPSGVVCEDCNEGRPHAHKTTES